MFERLRGSGTHVLLDREREPDRVPGSRVGILTDDQDLDVARADAGRRAARGRRPAGSGALPRLPPGGVRRARRCRGPTGSSARAHPASIRPASASSASERATAQAPSAPTEPSRVTGALPRPGEVDPQVGLTPRVVRRRDRTGLRVHGDRPHVGAAVAQQRDGERERAPAVGDVVDQQHAAPLEVRDVERRRQHLRRVQHRADAGVELHVQRSAVLRAERVGDRAAGQQTAAGDRDDHLGFEAVARGSPGRGRARPRRTGPRRAARAPRRVHCCRIRHVGLPPGSSSV